MSDRTYEQAAEELSVSVGWLKAKAQARQIAHHRYGRRVRFTDADLAAIRAQFAVTPLAPVSSTVLRFQRRAVA
jgi:excisionase family DNA binding protein